MTYRGLIVQAYRRRGLLSRAGAGISDSMANEGLSFLNEILDEWQNLERYAYNVTFPLFSLTPNHTPYLMGPTATSPDFTVSQRPIKILGCDLVLNSSNPSTDLIVNVRDDEWWLGQQVKTITSTIPTDLYPSFDYPNISLNFWPIPTVANQVRIMALVSLAQVASLTAIVSVPQAYQKALELTLAEELPADFPLPPWLPGQASRARVSVQTNNISSPRIASADFGTGAGSNRTGFNWRSGMPS